MTTLQITDTVVRCVQGPDTLPRRSRRRRPILCVECKWADTPVDKSVRYFRQRFPKCDAWQISATGTKDFVSGDGIRVAPALALLKDLV